MKTDTNLTMALKYLKYGWAVFPVYEPVEKGCSCGKPCEKVGKHPRVQGGFKKASKDHIQVESWWKQWPNANIGIATGAVSGFVALDIDPHRGGETSLQFLESKNNNLPQVPSTQTGGGGRHLLFKHPGFDIRNRTGLAKGIDFRGDGGYIITPNSRHQSGNQYEWRIHPDGISLPIMPDWLTRLIQGKKKEAFPDAIDTSGVPEGGRDNYIFEIISKCKCKGYSQARAEILALKAADNCTPPFDHEIVKEKINRLYELNFQASSSDIAPRIEWMTISQYIQEQQANSNVAWVWDKYLGAGLVTLLYGLPKAGKSTLFFYLIEALFQRKNFLGFSTALQGKIAIVTEESVCYHIERAKRFPLDDLYLLPDYKIRHLSFAALLEGIESGIHANGISFVIIDTLAAFWKVDDENNASKVTEAIQSVSLLAKRKQIPILLIHHQRKVDGAHGTSARGSGALVGAVDISLELAYSSDHKDTRRILRSFSRCPDTPKALVIELSDSKYISLGDPQMADRTNVREAFLNVLSDEYETIEKIKKRIKVPIGQSLLMAVVKECRDAGLMNYRGKGRRGDPYQYKADRNSIQSPINAP